jgi:hypothetical protein
MTRRTKAVLAASLVIGVFVYLWLRPSDKIHSITGIVTEIYKSERGQVVVAVMPDGRAEHEWPVHILLALRRTWGSEYGDWQIEVGKRYNFAIFKPRPLTTPVAWAANMTSEMKSEPNNAMEPTPVNVTVPANAGPAPFTSAAHLGR